MREEAEHVALICAGLVYVTFKLVVVEGGGVIVAVATLGHAQSQLESYKMATIRLYFWPVIRLELMAQNKCRVLVADWIVTFWMVEIEPLSLELLELFWLDFFPLRTTSKILFFET